MTFSSAAIIYSSANIGPGVIVNADINNSAAIAFSKMAALTASTMVYSNASGVIVATAAPTDGQLLIGSTGAIPSLAALTGTANQVVVTNGAASITLSLPQSIATTSSPTFAALTLTAPLALTNGGSNASLTASNGGIIYSTASAMAVLSGTSTAGQLLQSGASAAPTWSTTTYPATNAVSTLLYASSANVMAALATANDGVLITSATGVPSISSTIPSATQDNITRTGTVTSGTWSATAIAVDKGGTGQTTYTNGQLLIGNTTGNTLTKATLTGTANQITVTNSTGSITLSTPQDIATTSSPTFAAATLTGSGLAPLSLASTDAGAAAMVVDFYRDSATPAASDVLTQFQFNGEDSAGNKQLYADIQAVIEDPTSTSEDAKLVFNTIKAGTSQAQLNMLSTGCQVRGNETNTAPPAGFIGEQLISTNGTAIALTNDAFAEIEPLTLTPGNWDISGYVVFNTSGTVAGNKNWDVALSATTASGTAIDSSDGMAYNAIGGSGVEPISGVASTSCRVGPVRVSIAANTTYYLNAKGYASVTFTSVTADGTIKAVRVG